MPLDDVVSADFNSLSAPHDDNDWGDFLHSQSNHPGIASSPWVKPTGALPFSIFGFNHDEESHSKVGLDSKSFDLFDKDKNVVSSNLMFRFDENNNKGDANALNFDKNGLNFELGLRNSGFDLDALSSNRIELSMDRKVLASDPLSSNGNGVELDAKIEAFDSSSLNQNGFNTELGLDALSSNQNGLSLDSKVLAFDSLSLNGDGVKLDVKVESSGSSSLSQNGLNLDSKVPTLVVDDKSLSTSEAATGSGLDFNNGGFGNEDEEDDEWEFHGAEWKISDKTCQSGQTSTENGSISKFNEPNSLWNVPNSDKLVISASTNEISFDAQQKNSNLPDKNDDFWGNGKWEFMHAETLSVTGLGNGKDDGKRPETSSSSIFKIGFGSDAQEVGDLFGMSLGATQKPNEQDFAFDFKPSLSTENSSLSNIYSTTKENAARNKVSIDGKSGIDENLWAFKDAFSEIESKENDNKLSVDGKSDDDENSWAFKDAFSEIGLKNEEQPHDSEVSSAAHPFHGEVQENTIGSDNHKGAIPLSIFGDEEEADDSVVFKDLSMQMPNSSHADGIKSRHVNTPISDLLLSLYSQVEKNSSVNDAQSLDEDGLGSTNTTMPSDVQSAVNDFDDFKDASSQFQANDTVKSSDTNYHVTDLFSSLYGQAAENTSNHTKNSSENGILSSNTLSNPNLPNGGDTFGDNSWDFNHSFPPANIDEDFNDDTWEYQDASSGIESEDQTGTFDAVRPTKVDKIDYLDFFSKLKGELHLVALQHLENLKKAQSDAAVTGEDSRLEALNKEVQDLENVLYQDGLISSELQSDYSSLRNISLVEFIEVLKEPKHQLFESDSQLSKKLTQVEDSPTLVMELLKYVNLAMKILALLSVEEQSSFVSTWSKLLSICTQELKHGALIWNQALQRNVHEQILSVPQGKKQIIALGEIFRVVELLGCSIRLYKQWILVSSVDAAELMSLLNECSMLWSSSGLKEALGSISNLDGFEYDGSPGTLIESIQHIHDLDVCTLYDHAFSGDTICHLSLLKPGILPGMKTVVWNGENYFLPLANLWANLVSPDAPSLPSIHVRREAQQDQL